MCSLDQSNRSRRGAPALALGRRAPALVALLTTLGLLVWWAAPAMATNDPYFPEQWALVQIGAPAAWSRADGAGVLIGVVDTGVDLSHEDLAAKIVGSTNCIGANGDPAACHGPGQDDEGHGTAVAGIAAAITGNGKGIAGVAPGANLLVAKALSTEGVGSLADVNAGIKWVVDHGARVVNLSVESDGASLTSVAGQTLTDGVEYAWNHGAIPVVAAGNSTPSLFGSGAGYAGVDAVFVGATGPLDEVAPYSSSLAHARWGLVAPGGDAQGSNGRPSCVGNLAAACIVSTGWFPGQRNQYAVDEGTSMAAPEVSGALALLLGRGEALAPAAAVHRLISSAARIPCGPGCAGRLDLAAAVQEPPTRVIPAGPAPVQVRQRTLPSTTTSSAPALASSAPQGAVSGVVGQQTDRASGTIPMPRLVALGPAAARRATRGAALAVMALVAFVLWLAVSGAVASEIRRRLTEPWVAGEAWIVTVLGALAVPWQALRWGRRRAQSLRRTVITLP